MMKVNVRMNLLHFLSKPYETDVIDKLSEISADSIVFYLRLWYEDGTISIDLGAYGVPETLIINEKKIIIKKFVGPLNDQSLKEIESLIK